MLTSAFTTRELPTSDQFDAWCGWYGSVFEAASRTALAQGFEASNSNWTIGGFTLSQVASPPSWAARSRPFIRRNPVDHWVLTLSGSSTSEVTSRGERLSVRAGVPFLLSLGEEMRIDRTQPDSRMQLLLSRDAFGSSAPVLDACVGLTLDTPQGALLADFMLLLNKNVPGLPADEATPLKSAVQAMLEACLAPSASTRQRAERSINATLRERVRKVVARHLRSPSLSADQLCREAATSRSQLYRLLEDEGGVARYIQRRRLGESLAMLGDGGNNAPVGRIAEMLCFADASSFSRAFRREFGVSPNDVRAASRSGSPPALLPRRDDGAVSAFRDCLRSV